MEEETSDAMNLDLNLLPGPEPNSDLLSSTPMTLDSWDDNPLRRIREAVRIGARQRMRWRRLHLPPETDRISTELNDLMINSGSARTLQAGEGSVAVDAEARTTEPLKMCENNNGYLVEEALQNKDEMEKKEEEDGGFFDCNICLELAKNPVVTCCGHMFCWSCLYRWLHFHSDAKECPVCKGEVTLKNVTPIYGRGSNKGVEDEDLGFKIPDRPQARRVESLRQTIRRNMLSLPMEEMIRHLGSRFDLRGNLFQPQESESAQETADRTSSLLSRILSRGSRREATPIPPIDEVMDLNQTATVAHSLLLRRTQSHRPGSPSLSSAYLVEAFRGPPGRTHEQPTAVEDRDSFSSIAAMINSESQMDAAEIDSNVSSSRRRSDASRVSDLDTGDSRVPRRRRLTRG